MEDYKKAWENLVHPPKKPDIDIQGLMRRLEKPAGPVDVVIDTDTYNEIDDQFAIAYLIRSEEKLNLKALYAAPFYNDHSESPEDGMERSFDEIHKILNLMKREELSEVTFKGSKHYLLSESEPTDSPAARDLARRAMEYTEERPLYVVAIGAITNVASAILMQPEIVNRIVIVWLGGNALDWEDNREFNCCQDVAAARVVFGCGAALVMLPCMGVVSSFRTSGPELEYWLKGKNALCDYLVDNTIQEAERVEPYKCWTRAIWDVTAVAWLLDGSFMKDRLEPSPIPQYDNQWSIDKTRHPVKYVYAINRDALFTDLFEKLAK